MTGTYSERRNLRWRWVLGALASITLVIGLADRSSTSLIEIGTPQRLIVVNSAGPVEVRAADAVATVEHRDSWIWSRPVMEQTVVGSDVVVRLSCPGRGPCRTSAIVEAPAGIELVVVSSGVVTVPSFDGSLTVLAEQDSVALGPIRGSARVVAHDNVQGSGLATIELDVSTVDGELILDFATAPERVLLVGSTKSILAEFPDDQTYNVTVEAAGGDVIVDVPEPSGGEEAVVVVARTAGPVTIQRRQLPETTVDVDS